MLCGVFEVDVKKSRSCYSLSDQCSCLYLVWILGTQILFFAKRTDWKFASFDLLMF